MVGLNLFMAVDTLSTQSSEVKVIRQSVFLSNYCAKKSLGKHLVGKMRCVQMEQWINWEKLLQKLMLC